TRRATSFFCVVRNLAYLLSAAAAPRSCHPAVPVKTGTTRLKPVRPRSGLVGNVVVHRVAGLALDQVDQPEADGHHHRHDGKLNGFENDEHGTALLNWAPAWPGPVSSPGAG